MDEAWEAVLAGNLKLAEKLARRAIDGSEMNPRLWLDLGRILLRCAARDDAEEALRRAIAIAPTMGEAFAELAALQAAAGKWPAAERLQRRAVELLPRDVAARGKLDGYAAMLAGPATAAPGGAAAAAAPAAFTDRTGRYDWDAVAAALREVGLCRLPGLLSPAECDSLCALWDADCFEHRVRIDDDARGRVEYRFFQLPLPAVVDAVRAEVYARLAPVADAWQAALDRSARFPAALADFLEQCRAAGQQRTTPILLRYAHGGWNAPHRDVAGRVTFPFQLAVTLRGQGGALQLVDQGPGRRARRRALETVAGDGALFCTQERLVEVGGVVAAQPVQHGTAPCTGERFALGVPFHLHG